MSDQAFRAAIKDRLLALGPVLGRVHDYERWTTNHTEFLRLFQDTASKKIFGWEIYQTGLKVAKGPAMNKRSIARRYMVRGYYGLDDAAGTEKILAALVDLIVLDLAKARIEGAENDTLPAATIQTRIFGSVLCHVAEIVIPELVELVNLVELHEEYLEVVGLAYYLTPGDDRPDAVDQVSLWDIADDTAISLGGSQTELDGEATKW